MQLLIRRRIASTFIGGVRFALWAERAIPLLTAWDIQRMGDTDIIGFHREYPPIQSQARQLPEFSGACAAIKDCAAEGGSASDCCGYSGSGHVVVVTAPL